MRIIYRLCRELLYCVVHRIRDIHHQRLINFQQEKNKRNCDNISNTKNNN